MNLKVLDIQPPHLIHVCHDSVQHVCCEHGKQGTRLKCAIRLAYEVLLRWSSAVQSCQKVVVQISLGALQHRDVPDCC